MENDISHLQLKDHILSSIDFSSNNLSVISNSFSKLYLEFQTEVTQQVHIEKIENTCFKWVYSDQSDKNKILLFFHGGGYTMGSTEDHLELIGQLILKTNATVLSVDYRLAPAFLFPAPLEDAQSAYGWLLKNGYSNHQIGFSGISAGGLLVTQLILKCQEDNIPLPKLALVMSGLCNLHLDAPSLDYNAERDWITLQRLHNIKKYYLPKDINVYKTILSPIDAIYTNYPTTLFQAGDHELLVEDSISSYQKLRSQNLDVYLDIVPGLAHCWQLFSKIYEPGRVAINSAANFLNQTYDK